MKNPNIHEIYEFIGWSVMVSIILLGIGQALLQAHSLI